MIRIHDTLSGELRPLEPREPGRVGIYVCGPTVYGRIHVGNARPFVVFSLYKRFLEHEGYETTLVINITDINDKIYDAARQAGQASERLAVDMADCYRADTGRIGLGRPDAEPLASETIDQIIDLIQSLIDRGHAYEAGGDVYFAVRSYAAYGQLSNRRVEEMEAGEQGEPDDDSQLKRDPLDFALWKAHKQGEDTYWDSPWGRGRPGWHIECSAMSENILGLDFDIHGGGLDLVFPHHENEIAQTEAGRGRPLARIWMHNGMIRFGAEKMAKSVGNIRLLHEALDQAGPEALVMYFLGGHYRQPLAFNPDSLEQAARAVERVRNACRTLADEDEQQASSDQLVDDLSQEFFEALRDDFNTPEALAALFKLVGAANDGSANRAAVRKALAELLPVLGLESLLDADDGIEEAAQRLADQREQARRDRDFGRADQIRDELAARGYEIRDTDDGPVLVRVAGS